MYILGGYLEQKRVVSNRSGQSRGLIGIWQTSKLKDVRSKLKRLITTNRIVDAGELMSQPEIDNPCGSITCNSSQANLHCEYHVIIPGAAPETLGQTYCHCVCVSPVHHRGPRNPCGLRDTRASYCNACH